jgi:hypothetical protein
MAQPMTRSDRESLYGVLDAYLEALVDKHPARLPLAKGARFSENSVELDIGDGLWNTINRRGDYDLRFADPLTGNVGWFGVVYEHDNPAAIGLRIKVEDGLITEVESVLARREGDAPFPNPNPEGLKDKPILNEIVPPDQRVPRARMRSIANGYFSTLELNDGTLFTAIDPACNRVENGVQTTNNPSVRPGEPLYSLGCIEQFKTGNYRYDDELRARRFPLIDEERGLVMAGAFIDHSGRLGEVRWTDGRVRKSPYRTPHSFCVLELFKIVGGRICQVEAVFSTVTYHIPTPWAD